MQTELPEWLELALQDHSFQAQRVNGFYAGDAVLLGDLRALLDGKVLCGKEPVAWQVAAVLDDKVHRDTFDHEGSAERYAMTDGGIVIPLYAPADTGKECGNG